MRKQAFVAGIAAAAALAITIPGTAAAAFGACQRHMNGTVCIQVNASTIDVRYQKTGGSDARTTFGYRYGDDYVTGPTVLVRRGQTSTQRMSFTRKKGKFIQGIVASEGTDIWLGLKSQTVRTN